LVWGTPDGRDRFYLFLFHVLPRHHDLRRAEHRGRGPRPARPGPGRGVNFVDTAEMYPVPPRAETQGPHRNHDRQLARQRGGNRDRLVLATKVAGPGTGSSYLRGGRSGSTGPTSRPPWRPACAPAHRLRRPLPAPLAGPRDQLLRPLGYEHEPGDDSVPLAGDPGGARRPGAPGKVRHVGVSNETPWGLMRYLAARRAPRAAADGQHPEPLQPAQPHLRGRAGRGGHARGVRPAGLLPARLRGALRQVPGRRPAARRAPHPVRALQPLLQPRAQRAPATTWPSPAATAWTRRRWRWPTSPRAPS
jgi:hypothetical protein